jgi:hypothetical protein
MDIETYYPIGVAVVMVTFMVVLFGVMMFSRKA